MSNMQQGDVSLNQTPDGGEITVEGGVVRMSGGLETAAYLSLFGGNFQDDGRDGNSDNWWGNLSETNAVRQYRSETQNLLKSLPLTSSNLRLIEDAVTRDLSWFLAQDIASSIRVGVSIPALNTVQIDVSVEAVGEEKAFQFVENWKSNFAELDISDDIGVVSVDAPVASFLLEDGSFILLEDGVGHVLLET